MAADDSLVARALSRPVPTFLGKISYGTYLWHWPVVLVLAEVMTVRPVVLTAMVVVLATALAALSYEVLEMPIRRTQLLNRFQWRTLVVGVAASALVAVAAVPALLGADRRPVLTASNSLASGADGSRPVPSGLDWAELADDLGPPVTYCEPGDTEECVVVDGDGPHMLLVGDSQARMFAAPLIKLAKLHGYKLSLSVIPGCPWQQGLVNRLDPQDEQDRCRSVREDLYDSVISDSGVDLVVLVSLPRDNGSWEEDLISLDHEEEPLQQRILQATNDTLDELDRIGVRTLIVEGMLETTGQLDPLDCLASAASMSECRVAVPITGPPSDAYYRTAAAMSENVFTVNINSVMCPAAPVCEPMLGGLPVWRDADHYLPKTLTLRKGKIWQAIEETGALEGLPQRP
jgi:hypothetical protein